MLLREVVAVWWSRVKWLFFLFFFFFRKTQNNNFLVSALYNEILIKTKIQCNKSGSLRFVLSRFYGLYFLNFLNKMYLDELEQKTKIVDTIAPS